MINESTIRPSNYTDSEPHKPHFMLKNRGYEEVVMFTIYLSQMVCIGVAQITQSRTCVIKIVTFKGGHFMW